MELSRAPTKVVRDWYMDSRHWDRYQPRPGDVVIATAPKVGTTWTQQIVKLLVFQSVEPRPLVMLSPWLDSRPMMPLDMMLGIIEGQQHRRFIKSHLPMDALPIYDEVKYIHVARDGRDAAMSFLNHCNSYTDEAIARFDAVGLEDPSIGKPYPRAPRTTAEFFHYWVTSSYDKPAMGAQFFDIERSYWAERRRPNVLLVHYNDLKADLSGEMARIAAFLGIETPADLWPQLVEAATFEAMQRDGGILLAGMEMGFQGGHKSFLHKASNNRWQGEVAAADLDLYDQQVAEEFSPTLARWVKGGRAVAGDPKSAA